MKLICNICNKENQFKYLTVWEDNRWLTVCEECRYGKHITGNVKTEEQIFNELQTPFWRLSGKAKPKDIALEKWMNRKGLKNYGDLRRYRDSQRARFPSAINDFNKHIQKYGRNNAPEPVFQKEN